MTRTTYFLTLLLLLACWLTTAAVADERKVIPSIALKQGYSDNLYFSSESRESDFISTVSPGLEVMNNTERMQAGLKMRLDGSSYWENESLNSIDQDYSGKVRYAVSPRANVFTSAGYKRDSQPDRDFEQTGLVYNAVTRDRYTYRLGGDYALSEVMNVQLTYSFDDDTYDSSEYSDYQSHTVSCLLSRDLSAFISRTVGRINVGATKFDYDASEATNYTGTIGAERSLDERLSYFADIGLRYTESTFDAVRLVPSGITSLNWLVPYEAYAESTGITGQTGMSYKGELTSAKLFVSHDVSAASGQNGTVERTAVQAQARRRLNETSSVGFSAGYAYNKSTQDGPGTESTDETSLWLQPRVIYTLTEQIALETSYSYSLVHDKVADTDAYRNLIMVRLDFQYPMFE